MGEHALLSASGASRWLLCPGSLGKESRYEEGATEASELGTMLHNIAQQHLIENSPIPFDRPFISEYCEYIKEVRKENRRIEERVYYNGFLGVDKSLAFGTCDAILFREDTQTLEIVDLKTGRMPVYAKYNPQLFLYLLGALEKYSNREIKKYKVTIFQPDNINSFEYTREEILEEVKVLSKKAHQALAKKPEIIPGKTQCSWCKHRGNCSERGKYIMDKITVLNSFIEGDITSEEAAEIVLQKREIIGFLNDVEKSLESTLKEGGHIKGFRIKEKKGHLKWKSKTQDFLDILEIDLNSNNVELWERTLRTPTQIKNEMGGEEILNGFIDRPTIGYRITREENITLAEAFND